MACPKCGYPHATPPKCKACGAEIKEEVAEPIVEEPTEEEAPAEEETPE